MSLGFGRKERIHKMDVNTLREVMGNYRDVNYDALVGPMNEAMIAAGCTNLRRAAMWCAQIGHESEGLKYMEEIASGAAYEGRLDLGNTQPGDGVRYKGRGPIQLTGRSNYRAFTTWTRSKGYSTIDFEAEPHKLSEPKWGFLAASFYWTVRRTDINSLADQGDVTRVTHRINGGENGLSDRIARYNRAMALGDRILPSASETGTQASKTTAVEKVLDYKRDWVKQDTYYNCGPASCQTVIGAATGSYPGEVELAAALKTTINGTDWIGVFPGVLNKYLAGGKYSSREMPNDPPRSDQRDQLWKDIVNSIDSGYGVVANIVAPPSNYPRASYKSTQSPAYAGGTVYHYVAVMGYATDSNGRSHVWVADSGFAPYGYWMTLQQLSTLIPPKGYAYSTNIPQEGLDMDAVKQIIDFVKGWTGPMIQDIKDIRQQLTGGRDTVYREDGSVDLVASYPGWRQLGTDKNGNPLSMVDSIAWSHVKSDKIIEILTALQDRITELEKKVK